MNLNTFNVSVSKAQLYTQSLLLIACVAMPVIGHSFANRDADDIVIINSNTKLTRDYHNTQFRVTKDNVTLDLGGHKITGARTRRGRIAIHVYANNVTIRSGVIANLKTAIRFHGCLKRSDIPLLTNEAYENTLRKRCIKKGKVENMHFSRLKGTAVYVSSYVTGIVINRNTFDYTRRMAIYLDSGSRHNIIQNNTFKNNGFRSSLLENYREAFKKKRGHISIDASSHNIIRNNLFVDTKRKINVPAIELYRNCGEANFHGMIQPRLQGADHNLIENNTFQGTTLGVWLQYREHDNLRSCTGRYRDQANYNTLKGNRYINVKRAWRDDGVGNKHF